MDLSYLQEHLIFDCLNKGETACRSYLIMPVRCSSVDVTDRETYHAIFCAISCGNKSAVYVLPIFSFSKIVWSFSG